MAAPHVAGVAALYLQNNPNAAPAQVATALTGIASPNVVRNPGSSSPNRLLHNQFAVTPTCFPEYPNLRLVLGSEDNDPNLTGTANGDRICGLGGNDTINSAGGDDLLQGNIGDDTINGDAGDDLLQGGQNNDTLSGGDGSDTLYGNLGNDILYGNTGNDYAYGGDGTDTLYGGQNDDVLFGDAGNDAIHGNKGNDHLWGGAGVDTFYYAVESGYDTIYDFQWSEDRLQLDGITIASYTFLGLDCRINLSTGAAVRLLNTGVCRTPTIVQ